MNYTNSQVSNTKKQKSEILTYKKVFQKRNIPKNITFKCSNVLRKPQLQKKIRITRISNPQEIIPKIKSTKSQISGDQ